MAEPDRPDSEALLRAVMHEEQVSSRGQLRLFFGMAPGVGKTYAMLEAAREKMREGVDVVVGCVETHGRRETARLLEGLPLVPKKHSQYRGISVAEMDIDAILARRPRIVLVDELAHTNAPGSRHEKRWQDVVELLTNGIDVYSTLNVQHLESRVEAVREITGVTVRERVPDSILDMADGIEVIDLDPEVLLQRLAEGKVYLGDMAATAASHFFRTEHLIALREMALRLTADRVDRQLRHFVRINRMEGSWKAAHRLLVAVGPSPHSASLIRWTRSLATALEATWTAVSVQPVERPDDADSLNVEKNLSLARELGAEIVVTSDSDLVAGILRVARQNNITQIVVGKSPVPFLRRLTGQSFIDRLIRESGTIDIHVVRVEDAGPAPRRFWRSFRITSRPAEYLIALSFVVSIPLLSYTVLPFLGHWTVALLQLMAIFGLAIFVGRGPIIAAASVSAVVWEFFFLPPRLTIYISRLEDILMFLLYFAAAGVMGSLTARTRAQERAARMRENQIASFYSFMKDIAVSQDAHDVVRNAVAQLRSQFSARVAILLADQDGRLTEEPSGTLTLSSQEHTVAEWAYRNKAQAGRGTGTLQSTPIVFTPLLAPGGAVGVIGIRREDDRPLVLADKLYFDSFISQVAAGIERKRLEMQARTAMLLHESQRLQKTLLNAISHELRTPLSALTSAATALSDGTLQGDAQLRDDVAREVLAATERLNRVVENLLDMSRLESGRLVLKEEWTEIADVIGAALRRVRPQAGSRTVRIDLQDPLPLLRIDGTLVEQVLVNVLHNAFMYTPPDCMVTISARRDDARNEVLISVHDTGQGIPGDALPFLFDKFYRVPGSAAGGIGLGLSIARGLVEAHGGVITAENHPEGGACIAIRLPVAEPPAIVPEEE